MTEKPKFDLAIAMAGANSDVTLIKSALAAGLKPEDVYDHIGPAVPADPQSKGVWRKTKTND